MPKLKSNVIIFMIVRLIASILLLWALKKQPYSYYTLLRWVICCVAIYGIYFSSEMNKTGWIWIFGPIALLFNPVFPVHLSREIWRFVDIGTAVLFLTSIFFIRKHILKNETAPNTKENSK